MNNFYGRLTAALNLKILRRKLMRKVFIFFTAVLMLCAALSSCYDPNKTETSVKDVSEEFVGGGFSSATLVFDFSFGAGAEHYTEEPYMSDSDMSAEAIVEIMTLLTGINFDVRVSYDDGRYFAEWGANSDIFAEFNAVNIRDEFSFADVAALRWFMLDSMWRTLLVNFGSEIYFVTNRAHDDIVVPSPFSHSEPFRGSPFYTGFSLDFPIFSNELYYLDGDIEKDTLTVNFNNGDFAVFDVDKSEVSIYGFEIVDNIIQVLDESGETPVVVFTVAIVDKHTLQHGDSGEIFKIAEGGN